MPPATTSDAPIATPTTPVAPATPAAAPAADRSPLESFTPEQRADWEKTGTWPTDAAVQPAWRAPAPPPAVETPAIETPEPATDTVYPSEHARFVKNPRPPGVSKRQHLINELARHGAEQEQKARELEAEIRGRSAPAPAPPAAATPPAADLEPTEDQFPVDQFATAADPYRASMIAFAKAHSAWAARDAVRQDRARQQQETQQTDAERVFNDTALSFAKRRDALAATTPAFVEKAIPLLNRLIPSSRLALIAQSAHPNREAVVQAHLPDATIADVVMHVDEGPQLALHLAEHPEIHAQIRGLHREAQIYQLGLIAAQYRTPAAAPAPAPAPAPPRPVSAAPPPPPMLGDRPADPADASKAALARDDFRAFDDEETKKDLARVARR